MKFMNDQRVSAVHRGAPEVIGSARLVPFAKGTPAEKRQMVAFGGVIRRPFRQFNVNGTPTEVIATCAEYFNVLEEFVSSFLMAHEQPLVPK